MKNQISSFSIITPTKELYVIKGDFNIETPQPRCKLLFADQYLEIHPGDFWSDIKTTGLKNEGGVEFTNGKKPEKLIERAATVNGLTNLDLNYPDHSESNLSEILKIMNVNGLAINGFAMRSSLLKFCRNSNHFGHNSMLCFLRSQLLPLLF